MSAFAGKLPSARHRPSLVLWALGTVSLALVLLPTAYSLIWSLWGTETLGLLDDEASGQWFQMFWASSEWRGAFFFGAASSVAIGGMGTLLLAAHFFAARLSARRTDPVSVGLLLSVLLVPTIVYALALRYLGGQASCPQVVTLFVGQLILVLPIQYFILEAAQSGINRDVLLAGIGLGCSHRRVFLTVYIPVLARALLASALVGALATYDEVVVSSLVVDSEPATVARRLWDNVARGSEPFAAVASILMLLVCVGTVVMVDVVHRVVRRLTT
jgi:ABC-type spermidine/putrescine transport system permease subunit II